MNINSKPGYSRKKEKSVSLNHLLNFSYESSRDVSSDFDTRRHRSVKPMFNKEQYVLANFHFLVRPPSQVNNTNSSFYQSTLHDPNKLVNWETVEVVECRSHQPITCPICLETPPFAAKITKCGHIFCYSCILHYLTLTTETKVTSKKCPMCNESVYSHALKSVIIHQVHEYQANHTITLSLMIRPKKTIIPFRKLSGKLPLRSVYPLYGTPDSHLCRYNVVYDLSPIIQGEMQQLKEQAQSALSMSETLYTEVAEAELRHRLKEWQSWAKQHLPHGPPKESSSSVEKRAPHISPVTQPSGAEEAFGSVFEDEENDGEESGEIVYTYEQEQPSPSPPVGLATSPRKHHHAPQWDRQPQTKAKANPYGINDELIYFYQSDDEQLIFLNPLNVKMIKEQYGDYENWPAQINAPILEIHRYQLTEAKRKQHPSLYHIPLSADVAQVELDMQGIVSPEILDKFFGQIESRAEKRRMVAEKGRREEEHQRMLEESQRQARVQAYKEQIETLNSRETFPTVEDLSRSPPMNPTAFPFFPKGTGSSESSTTVPAPAEVTVEVRASTSSSGSKAPKAKPQKVWGLAQITKHKNEKAWGPAPAQQEPTLESLHGAWQKKPQQGGSSKPKGGNHTQNKSNSGSKKGKIVLFST